MPGLPRPRLLLSAIALISLVGGGIGLLAATWDDREATLQDWRLDLSVSARLMETQLRGIHTTATAHLLRIEDRLGDRPWPKPAQVEGERRWLETIVSTAPHAVAACLRDDKGNLVVATERSHSPLCDIGHKERQALVRAAPDRTAINAILDDRHTPDHVVAFSRALAGPSGTGMAEILVDAAYFSELFRKVQPPDQGSIFLIARLDGDMVARYPMPAGPLFRFDTAKSPFTEFSKAQEGTYSSVSVVDGIERLISFRRLPDLDVVLTAGMTTAMVYRDWNIRTQRNAALFAGAMLLLLALAAVTNESLRHEHRLLRSMEHKAGELTAALAEKDVLFQEVHHRVKNNLQVISSLLTMQTLHVTDQGARDALKDALDRITSMGLVHQTLYEHNLAANVDLGIYFGRLAEALVSSYASRKGGITVQVDVTGTMELERAVPLGMLANEALTNALKHAFPDGRPGHISIRLTRDEAQWHFAVRDDGIGMPDRPTQGIGLSLIKALSRQLNGKSAISRDDGTVVVLNFPV